MSILVNSETKVIVQGLTGREGRFHAEQMMKYGTKVVAGVTPGKGGQEVLGVPVFNSCEEAVKATGADTSVVFVPAMGAADSACEASAAGVKLVVLITEHIPVLDMIRVKEFFAKNGTQLIGPNCPGIITPKQCKIGIMPGYIFEPGPIGLISRSGTLTYEATWQLTQQGLGQSTCCGIGGDQVPGLYFTDMLKLFRDDPETKAVCMIGGISQLSVRSDSFLLETDSVSALSGHSLKRRSCPLSVDVMNAVFVLPLTWTCRNEFASLRFTQMSTESAPAFIRYPSIFLMAHRL